MEGTLLVATLVSGLAGGVITVSIQAAFRYWTRPKLSILPYEHRPPFYRATVEGQPGQAAAYVNVGISNIGHRTAKRCQPLVTAMAERTSNTGWVRETNWVPVPLQWALAELEAQPSGLPAVERDLIPEPRRKSRNYSGGPRYFFNLVKISAAHENEFHLLVTIAPHAQRNRFCQGEYCFQVTFYSEDADWAETWFRVALIDSFGPLALQVDQLPAPPWKR